MNIFEWQVEKFGVWSVIIIVHEVLLIAFCFALLMIYLPKYVVIPILLILPIIEAIWIWQIRKRKIAW